MPKKKLTEKDVERIAKEYYALSDREYPGGWKTALRADGRVEYSCPHGVGHGGIHGCDGCCGRDDFPSGSDAPAVLTDELLWYHKQYMNMVVNNFFQENDD